MSLSLTGIYVDVHGSRMLFLTCYTTFFFFFWVAAKGWYVAFQAHTNWIGLEVEKQMFQPRLDYRPGNEGNRRGVPAAQDNHVVLDYFEWINCEYLNMTPAFVANLESLSFKTKCVQYSTKKLFIVHQACLTFGLGSSNRFAQPSFHC